MNYIFTIIATTCRYWIYTQSFNLLFGFAGILNIAQVAFAAVGAYTTVLLNLHGVPFEIAFIAGGINGAFCAFILSLPILRLREDYIVLATLGFAEIVRLIAINWISLTRGPLGIPGIPNPTIFGWHITTLGQYTLFMVIVTMIILAIIWQITHSPFGKLLEAIREDETATKTLGKNVIRAKIEIFVMSGFFTGLGGALFAYFLKFIDPNTFNIEEMLTVLLCAVIGGLGTFWGGIIGPVIIQVFFETLRFLPIPSAYIGPLRYFIYASLFLGVILLRPQGVLGRRQLAKKKS